MGALRLDQGPRDDRHPQRRAGRHRPPLHLPQVPRLRRHQRDARPARPDPPRGWPARTWPTTSSSAPAASARSSSWPRSSSSSAAGATPRCRSSPPSRCWDRLAERGIITREAERQLAAATTSLRRVEHRLQYLDDAQTHNLPGNPTTRRSSPRHGLRQLRGPARRARHAPGDRRQTLRQRLRQPHRGRTTASTSCGPAPPTRSAAPKSSAASVTPTPPPPPPPRCRRPQRQRATSRCRRASGCASTR